MFNSNQAFLLVQKLKYKKSFNLPQVTNRCFELYGLVLDPRIKKKDTKGQFAILGTKVPAFINILTSMF
jgi:hypothetical protein